MSWGTLYPWTAGELRDNQALPSFYRGSHSTAGAGAAPSLSPAGSASFYYELDTNQLMFSVSGGAWTVLAVASATDIVIADNTPNAFQVREAANDYIDITTANGAEVITLGSTAINPVIQTLGRPLIVLPDNTTAALVIREGAGNEYLQIDTTNGTERIRFGEVSVSASLAAATFNVPNANTTAFNIIDNSRSFFVVDTSTPLVRVGGTVRVDIGSVGVSGSQTNIVIPNNVSGSLSVMSPASVGYILVNTNTGNELILLGNNSNSPVIRMESLFEINDAWRISNALSPAALGAAGTTNDYNPAGLATTSLIRQAAAGVHTITGLVPPDDTGRTIAFLNISASILTLNHEDAGSAAANRFLLPGAVAMAIAPNASVRLWYDLTSDRWRTIGAE